jgi:hypothetical protein
VNEFFWNFISAVARLQFLGDWEGFDNECSLCIICSYWLFLEGRKEGRKRDSISVSDFAFVFVFFVIKLCNHVFFTYMVSFIFFLVIFVWTCHKGQSHYLMSCLLT